MLVILECVCACKLPDTSARIQLNCAHGSNCAHMRTPMWLKHAHTSHLLHQSWGGVGWNSNVHGSVHLHEHMYLMHLNATVRVLRVLGSITITCSRLWLNMVEHNLKSQFRGLEGWRAILLYNPSFHQTQNQTWVPSFHLLLKLKTCVLIYSLIKCFWKGETCSRLPSRLRPKPSLQQLPSFDCAECRAYRFQAYYKPFVSFGNYERIFYHVLSPFSPPQSQVLPGWPNFQHTKAHAQLSALMIVGKASLQSPNIQDWAFGPLSIIYILLIYTKTHILSIYTLNK